ncbi:MAG: MaoC family dehydratase [Dehalococcoidia bacterium]
MSRIAEGEVYVGLDCGSREFTITPDMVKEYAEITGDRNPWYSGPSPFGGAVAPALIRHSEVYRFDGWYLKNVYGNLHAKQDWEFFQPMMVGDRITARSLVADRYVKRERDYVVNEVNFFGPDGRLLRRGRTHQAFLIDESVRGMLVDKESAKAGARKFEIGTGEIIEAIPTVTKYVTREMSRRFSGPEKNYHTDEEVAHQMGFPDIVVQGMFSVCFLSEMLTNRFGQGWYQGGRMSVNLVNVLWPEEEITCHGVIKELTAEGSRQRAHLEIWCEKADGIKTIVGRASAVVV